MSASYEQRRYARRAHLAPPSMPSGSGNGRRETSAYPVHIPPFYDRYQPGAHAPVSVPSAGYPHQGYQNVYIRKRSAPSSSANATASNPAHTVDSANAEPMSKQRDSKGDKTLAVLITIATAIYHIFHRLGLEIFFGLAMVVTLACRYVKVAAMMIGSRIKATATKRPVAARIAAPAIGPHDGDQGTGQWEEHMVDDLL